MTGGKAPTSAGHATAQPTKAPVSVARWTDAVPWLSSAGRLIVGQLADRASPRGRVRVSAADLAACCCLSVSAVSDALADLTSRGLLGRDGGALVLVLPIEGSPR